MKLPQINQYVKYIDNNNNNNNKCINTLIDDKELLKNTMKYVIRLVIY